MTQVFLEVEKQASTVTASDSAAALEKVRGASMPLTKTGGGIARVEPYVNPAPKPWYDVVVLGGDPAARRAASAAAMDGGRVALVEPLRDPRLDAVDPRLFLQALVKIAADASAAARSKSLGVVGGEQVSVDFGAVMQHAKSAAMLGPQADDVRAYAAKSGVETYLAEGRFTGPDSISADGQRLRFGRAIIAVGGAEAAIGIPGLDAIPYYTDRTLHEMTSKPRRVAVVGDDATAAALAQSLARLGCATTLVASGSRLLPESDPDVADLLTRSLIADGVTIKLSTHLSRVQRDGLSYRLIAGAEPAALSLETDAVVICAGRRPELSVLDLRLAGVKVAGGLVIDAYLRTSNKRILACGEACLGFEADITKADSGHGSAGPTKYNAVAVRAGEAGARLAGRNAVSAVMKRVGLTANPTLELTWPQIAHVGFDQKQAAAYGIAPTVHRINLSRYGSIVHHAKHDGGASASTTPSDGAHGAYGLVKLWTHGKAGQILGATVVSENAAEVINTVSAAMANGVSLHGLREVLPARPSVGEAIERGAWHHGPQAAKKKRGGPWLLLRR